MLEGIVTWAEIDLDAIAANVRSYIHHVGPQVEVIAVVKANAYGHGAVPVARAALAAGATRLAVHRAIEGVELRRAGITEPILILGYTPPSGADLAVEWRLTPSLITPEFAQAVSARAAASGITLNLHLKVDTGMSRYGLFPQEVIPFLNQIQSLPGIHVEGIFTHLATADWADSTFADQQVQRFQEVVTSARQAGHPLPLAHMANSAGAMKLRSAHFNAVRPGISMYGMDASDQWPPVFPLVPALTLKSRVSRVYDLPAGAGISYSRTYVTPGPMRAALVPVGYGDGYHRILSNQGFVLIHGQRTPIRGRVCMDQFVVDVSSIPGVAMEDEVVLVGRQGTETLRAEEVAGWANTINYEVTTSLLSRVARAYLRGGEIQEVYSLGG